MSENENKNNETKENNGGYHLIEANFRKLFFCMF
jgi:hypothetical protein